VSQQVWHDLVSRGDAVVVHCLHFDGYRSEYESLFPGATGASNEQVFLHGIEGAFVGADVRILTPELMQACAWAEPVALKMMDRLALPHMAEYSTRLLLYRYLVAYWAGTISSLNANAFFMETEPHEVADFVLFVVARAVGVRTAIVTEFPSLGRSTLVEDYRQPWNLLFEGSPDNDRASDEDAARRAIGSLRGEYESAKPIYMRHNESLGSATTVLARARVAARNSLGAAKRIVTVSPVRAKRKSAKRLAQEYQIAAGNPDLSSPYIYFCLQFQPEKTTSPCGGIFVDQYLAIALIAKYLPPGWRILVKEHPGQYWAGPFYGYLGRDPGYYRRLLAIPEVELVSLDSSHFEIIDNSAAVATVTGTVGWEAIARGVPTVVFGDVWFADAPGAHRVRNTAECREALADVARRLGGSEPSAASELVGFVAGALGISTPLALSELWSSFYGREWNQHDNVLRLRSMVLPWIDSIVHEGDRHLVDSRLIGQGPCSADDNRDSSGRLRPKEDLE
jgi:hypothetical protein